MSKSNHQISPRANTFNIGLFGGSNKVELWRLLSEEIGGRYAPGHILKSARVELQHGPWTITLDTNEVWTTEICTTHYTRMRAPFVSAGNFQFSIDQNSVMSGLSKLIGFKNIEIGDEQFDRDYFVQSNNRRKLRSLLESERLRDLIREQPEMHLKIWKNEGWRGPRFPKGVDELRYEVLGVVTDVERLTALFELFAETLDQLVAIGATEDTAPRVLL